MRTRASATPRADSTAGGSGPSRPAGGLDHDGRRAKNEHKNDTSKNLWQITYTLDPEVETYHGRTVSEFSDLNPSLPSARRVWLKRRLLSIGVNDEQAATLEPADIIGTEVSVTVRNKNTNDKTYVNVTKVELRSNAGAGNPYVATF